MTNVERQGGQSEERQDQNKWSVAVKGGRRFGQESTASCCRSASSLPRDLGGRATRCVGQSRARREKVSEPSLLVMGGSSLALIAHRLEFQTWT
jgi:hypothetical protein